MFVLSPRYVAEKIGENRDSHLLSVTEMGIIGTVTYGPKGNLKSGDTIGGNLKSGEIWGNLGRNMGNLGTPYRLNCEIWAKSGDTIQGINLVGNLGTPGINLGKIWGHHTD